MMLFLHTKTGSSKHYYDESLRWPARSELFLECLRYHVQGGTKSGARWIN